MAKTKEEMLAEIEDKASKSAKSKAQCVSSAIRAIKYSIESRVQVAARSSCRNLKVTAFEFTISNEEDSKLDKDNALVKELTDKYVDTFAHTIANVVSNEKDIKLKAGKVDKSKFPPDIKFFVEL